MLEEVKRRNEIYFFSYLFKNIYILILTDIQMTILFWNFYYPEFFSHHIILFSFPVETKGWVSKVKNKISKKEKEGKRIKI